MNPDLHDIKEYADRGCGQAFQRIVERHSAMVHGVASRMTGNVSLAEEITQSVFILLARKARAVPAGHLSGWLHNATRGESLNAIRKESRRTRLHQQYMASMNDTLSPDGQWKAISPHLDRAVGQLPAVDRELVILRYFEQRSFQEISSVTGRSVEACKKRAQRALERLGTLLGKRGVTIGSSSLAALLAAGALQPATASAAAISGIALGSTSLSTWGIPGIFKFIQLMTTKQIAVIAAGILALAAIPTLIGNNRQTSNGSAQKASNENDALQKPSSTPAASSNTGLKNSVEITKPSINWTELVRTKFNSRSEIVQIKEAKNLAERLKELSDAELVQGLDEVTKMDISLDQKLTLRELLIGELAERDPMLVLNRFPEDKTNNSMLDLNMSPAYEALVNKDPAAAEAWLKQQLEAGNVKNQGTIQDTLLWSGFESTAVSAQLRTDPRAATQRIMSLPADRQVGVLMGATDLEFPRAFEIAMSYYDDTKDDSLLNRLMESDNLDSEVRFRRGSTKTELEALINRMPNATARAGALERLNKAAAQPPVEGVPLDLILEGQK